MAQKIDLTGQRFGMWTVIKSAENLSSSTMWLCKCDCGTVKPVRTYNLRKGTSKSCGCNSHEHLKNRERNYPTDVRIRRLYESWRNMLQRCNDIHNPGYKNYGGRGIKVCEEWKDYVTFARWAIKNGYADNLTIDRIDNNKGYCPSNCRWATVHEQINNRRNSRFVSIDGATKTITTWAREFDIEPNTFRRRLDRGMDPKEALTKRSKRKPKND